MKTKIIKGIIIFNIIFFIGLGGVFIYINKLKTTPVEVVFDENYKFSEEEIFMLNKSAIVDTITTVEGTIKLPWIERIEFSDGSVQFSDDRVKSIDIKRYNSTYKGHIVSSDGYVVTGLDILSIEKIKKQKIAEYYGKEFKQELKDAGIVLNDFKPENRSISYAISGTYDKVDDALLRPLLEKTTGEIQKKVVVLNPLYDGDDFDERNSSGFEAKVISVDNDLDGRYLSNHKDVALIKIDQSDLPAVNYADRSEKTLIGDAVGIIKSEMPVEMPGKKVEEGLESGSMIANQKSKDKTIDKIKTDISEDYSLGGGPMFNDIGNVIGVISSEREDLTNMFDQPEKMVMAVPHSDAINLIDEFKIDDENVPSYVFTSEYISAMSHGKQLYDQKHCVQALEKFAFANSLNEIFKDTSFADKYIKECEEIISRGESIDTKWDEQGKSLW